MNKEDQQEQVAAVETLRSSSSSLSRRSSTSENHEYLHSNKHINRSSSVANVNVGCMAGVFHLFTSKYYRRRKFLTFSASGKNNNKKRTPARSRNNNSPASKQELSKQELSIQELSKQELPAVINQSHIDDAVPLPDVDVAVPDDADADVDVYVGIQNNNTSTPTVLNDDYKNDDDDRILEEEEELKRSSSLLSREDVLVVSRSPTIPAGIRRRSTSLDLDSPKLERQMPLVARLMGLQDHYHNYSPPTPPPPLLITQSGDEKRRKLLGALEKCDEDLNTLRKIVQEAAVHVRSLSNPAIIKTCIDQPSPASVLDDFAASSPTSSEEGQACHFPPSSTTTPTTQPKPGRLISTRHQMAQIQWWRSWSPGARSTTLFRPRRMRSSNYSSPSITTQQLQSLSCKPQRRSNINGAGTGMLKKEIVEQVCRDVVWGQTWEFGRIAMVIEVSVFRDLLEELAREILLPHAHRPRYTPLPFHTCKRKLHF